MSLNRAAGPLSRAAQSSYNCFMQIWQAERAASQSAARSNRGRSKFRGSKFGAKKALLPQLLSSCMESRSSELDGQESHNGSDSASEKKGVNTRSCKSQAGAGSHWDLEVLDFCLFFKYWMFDIIYLKQQFLFISSEASFLCGLLPDKGTTTPSSPPHLPGQIIRKQTYLTYLTHAVCFKQADLGCVLCRSYILRWEIHFSEQQQQPLARKQTRQSILEALSPLLPPAWPIRLNLVYSGKNDADAQRRLSGVGSASSRSASVLSAEDEGSVRRGRSEDRVLQQRTVQPAHEHGTGRIFHPDLQHHRGRTKSQQPVLNPPRTRG